MTDLSSLTELGAFRDYSLEERNKYYTSDICVPTPDEHVSGIDRCVLLRDLVSKHNIESVLDLGCHDGFVTRSLVKLPSVGYVVGVDLNESAITAAREIRNRDYKDENLLYVQKDLFSFLETDPRYFDLVVMTELIEHFQLQEVFTLLKGAYEKVTDGGFLFISSPYKNGRWGLSNPDKEHITLFDLALLETVIDDVLQVPSDVFLLGDYCYAVVNK